MFQKEQPHKSKIIIDGERQDLRNETQGNQCPETESWWADHYGFHGPPQCLSARLNLNLEVMAFVEIEDLLNSQSKGENQQQSIGTFLGAYLKQTTALILPKIATLGETRFLSFFLFR